MLNFCVFTFILYAVASSVRTILFGAKAKQRKSSAAITRRRAIAPAARSAVPTATANYIRMSMHDVPEQTNLIKNQKPKYQKIQRKRTESSSVRILVRDSGTVRLETAVARVEHFSESNARFSFTPAGIKLSFIQLLSGKEVLI